MTTPESRVRKSSRQPVPNKRHEQGISLLKNENTSRIKRKSNKNNDQSQLFSYDEGVISQIHNDQSSNIREYGKDQYLPCRLPNGTQLKVRFVVENKKEEKKKERENTVQPPSKQTSQPNPGNKKHEPNLLDMFKFALDNVDLEQGQSQINGTSKQVPAPVEILKAPSTKNKRPRQQSEDFIKKVLVQNKKMVIIHSQLEQIEFPVDWEQVKMAQQNTIQIEEIQKKLESCKALKNLPIFAQ